MPQNNLKRNLKSRHLTMIALGGAIGTGLFVASGSAVHDAGPGGALIAYTLVALVVYFLMTSLGEMSSFAPTTGTFSEYCEKYIDPAYGFAMGWNYWFNWALTIATELLAAGFLMQFWFPHTSVVMWSAMFFFVIVAINLLSVRIYGESEYWLSLVKVLFIILFIVIGFLAIMGVSGSTGAVGFQNWKIGDAPFHGGFFAMLGVFLVAGYSFQGAELVGVAAGEAEDPGKNVPKAIKSTFWRLTLFYVLALGVIGFLVPYTSDWLSNPDSNVAMSPFTMVFKDTGFLYAASLVNAVIIAAVLSAANSCIYTSSRTLWYLARVNQAPKFLAQTNHKGTPIWGILFTSILGALFFLASFVGNGLIFNWLVNLISLCGYISWLSIAVGHLRFRRAYIAQGRSLEDLPYRSKFFPYAPIIAIVAILVMMFGQEVELILAKEAGVIQFFSTYGCIILFAMLYLGYKIVNKTTLIPLEACDLDFHKRH
ncbi:MAG: amino acid permease [Francisellaceae bacterium]